MPGWKTNAAVVVGTAGLVFGALGALGPDQPTEDERNRTRVEQQIGDLSDADEASKDRMRESGIDGLDMENRETLRPGERLPRLRIRLP
ncbi:hypothetical protein [Rhodococcus sp. NCIMB 12038]|uniref:hypothetical protein n=1 Tax=Rhodococcus sp. NCIMB 12038 TaxID=933800 RepID=UPI000B3D026F|nr:hypothetical protein [Rhodococcus sp. NCIMB 12038]OUS97272.1 hypothetical protein CA951_02695 [Rhodococcus sp. NCIMB 12038]